MMELGQLEIPMDSRKFLGQPMEEWSEYAVATGELKEDEPPS